MPGCTDVPVWVVMAEKVEIPYPLFAYARPCGICVSCITDMCILRRCISCRMSLCFSSEKKLSGFRLMMGSVFSCFVCKSCFLGHFSQYSLIRDLFCLFRLFFMRLLVRCHAFVGYVFGFWLPVSVSLSCVLMRRSRCFCWIRVVGCSIHVVLLLRMGCFWCFVAGRLLV